MAKSTLLDESLEMAAQTPETPAPAAVVLRPTIDLPPAVRMLKTSYWPATETKQAQYSGWSPELGCYARVYGELADELFETYGSNLAHGEETGAKVSLIFETYPNSNGLFFGARTDEERDFVSLNEYSVASAERWTPKVVFK